MSAEKEIVNYWYNKRGFFTINNLKSNNKDVGILAINIQSKEVHHVQVSCSLTGTIDSKEMGISAEKISEEKFYDSSISDLVQKRISFLENPVMKRALVLNSLPKLKKPGIIKEFGIMGVQIIEFEDIMYDTLENLDTQYYKNDMIRALQLVKFLLFTEPEKISKLLSGLASTSKKEFLSTILENDEIMKEFRKTNVERLSVILKNSNMKPKELAEVLDHYILNKRTRKAFLDSFMEQEGTRKIVNERNKIKKVNVSLGKFF